MSDVLIIGGGFAGVWSAAAATRLCRQSGQDLTVTLVAPGRDLVIRPRLYEADPAAMSVPLERVLKPVDVRQIHAVATAVDPDRRSVTVGHRGEIVDLPYRRLVLATGSALVRPDLPGAEYLHDVDTLQGAVALDAHLRGLPAGRPDPGRFTAVVVGAGFTGLEVATELVGRLRTVAGGSAAEVRVVLVERADAVGPELGPGPRPAILAALRELGVEVRLNTSVASLDRGAVHLTDGSEVAAHTCVWTAGMAASQLTQQIPGRRDRLGRLLVDQNLRVPESPEVFAAGDTAAAEADAGQFTLQSCQHAVPLGKYAGHNAAADLLGRPVAEFHAEPYATCLDLGSAGAVFTIGWERTVRLTGEPAKDLKRKINQQRIYPPLDDAVTILAAATLDRTWAEAAEPVRDSPHDGSNRSGPGGATIAADQPLPKAGKSPGEVMDLLHAARRQDPEGHRGRMTMFGMTGTDAVRKVSETAYLTFFHHNGMLANRAPSYSLTGMENDVLAAGIAILGGDHDARGVFTSGGSESNFLALHAIREWARHERRVAGCPQIIAPYSAHPTLDKAAHYLDMEVVRVPLREDLRGDPARMEAVIGTRTVALVGSAVCWSFGLFDPIVDIAAIAERHGLWMHVDASVGGWIAPFARKAGFPIPKFDLSVPGVCSISADLHKYGRTAKPASTIFFRNAELYDHTLFRFEDWPSGGYRTAGATGSRSGGAIASAWAVMQFLGEEGYLDLARRTMAMKHRLVAGLRNIEGLHAWDTDLVLQTYGSDVLDVRAIAEGLTARGHYVIGVKTPPLIHLQCDSIDDHVVDAYLHDVATVTEWVRTGRTAGRVSIGYA